MRRPTGSAHGNTVGRGICNREAHRGHALRGRGMGRRRLVLIRISYMKN